MRHGRWLMAKYNRNAKSKKLQLKKINTLPPCLIFKPNYSMANESKFPASAGSAITREEAREMINKYDKEHRVDKEKDTRSVFYGRELIETILGPKEVTGITFFLGSKPNLWAKKDTVQLVLVGTTEDGTLLWPSATSGKDMPDGGTAGDNGISCPPTCASPQP